VLGEGLGLIVSGCLLIGCGVLLLLPRVRAFVIAYMVRGRMDFYDSLKRLESERRLGAGLMRSYFYPSSGSRDATQQSEERMMRLMFGYIFPPFIMLVGVLCTVGGLSRILGVGDFSN
jgi:hypothetical protein